MLKEFFSKYVHLPYKVTLYLYIYILSITNSNGIFVIRCLIIIEITEHIRHLIKISMMIPCRPLRYTVGWVSVTLKVFSSDLLIIKILYIYCLLYGFTINTKLLLYIYIYIYILYITIN